MILVVIVINMIDDDMDLPKRILIIICLIYFYCCFSLLRKNILRGPRIFNQCCMKVISLKKIII